MSVLLFGLGMLVGALLALRLVARRRAAQQARQNTAVVRAQARVRALHAAALIELAEVTQIAPRRALVRPEPLRRQTAD